jgi:hemerythrin-like metal-binding protein
MPQIEWTESLELGLDRMDETHREFVDLLNLLADAPDDGISAAFEALFAHTVAHFEQEQRWMTAVDFPPAHCHHAEHEGVLEAMREVRGYLGGGKLQVGRVLARELAEWFRGHAATMDTMLAQFLRAHEAQAARVSA